MAGLIYKMAITVTVFNSTRKTARHGWVGFSSFTGYPNYLFLWGLHRNCVNTIYYKQVFAGMFIALDGRTMKHIIIDNNQLKMH